MWIFGVGSRLCLKAFAVTVASLATQTFAATAAAPVVSLSFSSATAILNGNSVKLSISISNPDSATLSNVGFVNPFPAANSTPLIVVAQTPAADGSCSGIASVPGSFNPQPEDTALVVAGAAIAAGESCTWSVSVRAAHTNRVYEYQVTYWLRGSAFGNDRDPMPADASAAILLRSPAKMNVGFTEGHNGQISFKAVEWFNMGKTPLTVSAFRNDALVSGIAPGTGFGFEQLSYGLYCNDIAVPGSSFEPTRDGTGYQMLAPFTIPANGSCTLYVNFRTLAPYGNHSFVDTIPEATVVYTDPAVVSQRTERIFNIGAGLDAEIRAGETSVAPGDAIRYSVSVINMAHAEIGPIAIAVRLTDGQTFLTGTVGDANYDIYTGHSLCRPATTTSTAGDTEVFLTVNRASFRGETQAPRDCVVIFSAMTPPTPTVVHLSLQARSVCTGDAALCNPGATNEVTVTPLTTLAASAQFASSALEEQPVRMTITLSNTSKQELGPITVNSALPMSIASPNPGGAGAPGQMRLASPAAMTSNCGPAVLSSTPGSSTVTIEDVRVPPRSTAYMGPNGSCTLSFDVVAPAGLYAPVVRLDAIANYANGASGVLPTVTVDAATVRVVATLNADLSGASTRYQAFTDGLVIVRYLLGVRGTAMTSNALAQDARRTNPTQIAEHLQSQSTKLDIDGNGQLDAATDGLLLLRYLMGLRGDALLAGAVGAGATRTTAVAIQDWLANIFP